MMRTPTAEIEERGVRNRRQRPRRELPMESAYRLYINLVEDSKRLNHEFKLEMDPSYVAELSIKCNWKSLELDEKVKKYIIQCIFDMNEKYSLSSFPSENIYKYVMRTFRIAKDVCKSGSCYLELLDQLRKYYNNVITNCNNNHIDHILFSYVHYYPEWNWCLDEKVRKASIEALWKSVIDRRETISMIDKFSNALICGNSMIAPIVHQNNYTDDEQCVFDAIKIFIDVIKDNVSKTHQKKAISKICDLTGYAGGAGKKPKGKPKVKKYLSTSNGVTREIVIDKKMTSYLAMTESNSGNVSNVNYLLAKKVVEAFRVVNVDQLVNFSMNKLYDRHFMTEILDDYIERPINELTLFDVLKKVEHTQEKVTDMQRYMYDVLGSSENFAELICSPTGSGKTYGLMAILSALNSITVVSQLSIGAHVEFIKSMIGCRIPFATAEPVRDKTTGGTVRIKYALCHETVGHYTTFNLSDFLIVLKRSERKIRNTVKPVTTAGPKVIIVHPELRKCGLMQVINDAAEYTEAKSLTDDVLTKLNVIIDDYCASRDDSTVNTDVIRAVCEVRNIMLLTATPPHDFDNKVLPHNASRLEKKLSKFTYKFFKKTLGMGVDLVSTVSGREYPVINDLQENINIVDNSVFFLQALSVENMIALMDALGDSLSERNALLNGYATIHLDDIRNRVITRLMEKQAEPANNAPFTNRMNEILYDVSLMRSEETQRISIRNVTGKDRILVFDYDPMLRAVEEFTFVAEADYVRNACREAKNIVDSNEKRAEQQKKLANSKTRSDDQTTLEAEQSESSNEVSCCVNRLDSKKLLEFLSTAEGMGIDSHAIELYIKEHILVLYQGVPAGWRDFVMKTFPVETKIIYSHPDIMGYGVNVPDLRAVYLPRQPDTSWEVLVQCVGRVGRPSNGMGVVYGTTRQLRSIFSDEPRREITKSISRSVVLSGFNKKYKIKNLKKN